MRKLKIAIVGSHPSPALAVIEQIKVTRPGWDIFFFGAKHSLTKDRALSYEYKETLRLGLPFYSITTGKKNSNILIAPIGIIQSLFWLKRLRPAIVLAFGGYIGVPVALAARVLRIPVVTHLQTLQMSLADKTISKLANKVFISWPQTEHAIDPNKVILTGLPLRKSILDAKKPDFVTQPARVRKPLLYITGGSQGAHFINQLVEKKLKDLVQHFYIIHQTGESTKYKDLIRLKELRQPMYTPLAHISGEDIGWILQNANIVIARAGMNTVSELLYFKKHAILIPLPMDNNEQQTNARLYRSSGLGMIIEQDKVTPDSFMQVLFGLYDDIKQSRLQVRKFAGEELQSPAAAERILVEIDKVIGKN